MKSKLKFGLAILAVFFVTACANTYNRIETGGTERTAALLDRSQAVLVTTPKDGGFAGKTYKGSGAATARRIDASLSRYARLVDVHPSEYHSLDELKDVITNKNYGYIVIPILTVWAHPEKGMSDISNRVSVKIQVIDAGTGDEVSSDFLEAEGPSPSSFYTLFASGNVGPGELLSNITDDYVNDLYGIIFPFLGW